MELHREGVEVSSDPIHVTPTCLPVNHTPLLYTSWIHQPMRVFTVTCTVALIFSALINLYMLPNSMFWSAPGACHYWCWLIGWLQVLSCRWEVALERYWLERGWWVNWSPCKGWRWVMCMLCSSVVWTPKTANELKWYYSVILSTGPIVSYCWPWKLSSFSFSKNKVL